MKNPLSAIAVAELAAALAPLQAALTNIENSDGSVETAVAQFNALQGEMLALTPTLQKIGIPALAAYANGQIAAWLASLVTPEPANPEPAPAPASSGEGKSE